jgi:DNA mismatch endonuclease, patch repair protein
MADIFSLEKRSSVMSKIKSKGSKIEAVMRKTLRKNKLSFRSQHRKLPGKPDFFLPKTGLVIFVDSCFWHGCRYHGTMPKSNKLFWKKKIEGNKTRDAKVNLAYKKMGLKILRIWEHELKSPKSFKRIEEHLKMLEK